MRVFVTGSGTDIGKTYATARWVEALRRSGTNAIALKPILSGMDGMPLEQTDAGRLVAATGARVTAESVERICPWRFGPPISPDMAASRAGRDIRLDEVVRFCKDHPAETLLVEGVGGVMVPINKDALVLDWMVALGFPVVLVTGSYLGALSHTLTAVQSIEGSGLALAAVLVSQSEDEPVPLEETVDTLQRFCTAPVEALPRGGSLPDPAWQAIADRCRAILQA